VGVVDSYSESNQSGYIQLTNGSLYTSAGQSFTGNGETLASCKFFIKKTGLPTGSNLYAYIYAHSGTFGTSSVPSGFSTLAYSDAFDVSTLTTSYQLTTFTFSGANQIALAGGTKYIVALSTSGWAAGKSVEVGIDDTSPSHAGNACRYNGNTEAFSALSGSDVCFYVESAGGGGGSNSAFLAFFRKIKAFFGWRPRQLVMECVLQI